MWDMSRVSLPAVGGIMSFIGVSSFNDLTASGFKAEPNRKSPKSERAVVTVPCLLCGDIKQKVPATPCAQNLASQRTRSDSALIDPIQH